MMDLRYQRTRVTAVRRTLDVLALLLLSTTIGHGQTPFNYGQDVQFDIRSIPFSRYGSYMEFKYIQVSGKVLPPDGVFLRTVHGNVAQRELFRVQVLDDGHPVSFKAIATPSLLTLKAARGYVEIFFAGPDRIRFRAVRVSVSFGTPYSPGTMLDKFAEPVDRPDSSARMWDYNASFEEDVMIRFRCLSGGIHVLNSWDGRTSEQVAFTFTPDSHGRAEGSIEEFGSSRHDDGAAPYTLPSYLIAAKQTLVPQQASQAKGSSESFDSELAELRAEYASWLKTMPTVPNSMQKTADLAAYVDWSAVVAPQGFYTRPAMLMSKTTMTNLWSWDNCFNAMALANAHPELAWDQFMWVFDSANADGISADYENDRSFIWNFSKPPLQGLTMAYLEQQNPAFFDDKARLSDLYPKLAKRTEWYLRFRNWDGDGLPQYNHGNDSGWDNATVFLPLPPVETPDLAAFMVLQMEELSHIAAKLGDAEGSKIWLTRADTMRERLVDRMWHKDHFVALHVGDHKAVEADSLLLDLPIMLGKQLPEDVRSSIIRGLEQPGHFLTQYGLASEGLQSHYYTKDGYWRGPIWAASTFLIAEGIDAAGNREFADDLRTRFCKLAMKSGFSENYDPKSGAPLRDPSYTWSSSVFLIFAHELQTHETSPFEIDRAGD